MKKEADPTTIPPAIGAFTISRMIKLPLMKIETQRAPMIDAPIPKIREIGPVVKQKVLKLWVFQTLQARKGKSRKIMRLPKSANVELKQYEVLKLFLDVEHPLSNFSRHIFKITPNAIPMNPPKVKIKYVPKGSLARFRMMTLLSSKPIVPIMITIQHSKAPALPKMEEKATTLAKAHLKPLLRVFPHSLSCDCSLLVSRILNACWLQVKQLVVEWMCVSAQKLLMRGQSSKDRAVMRKVKPRPDHTNFFRQDTTSPKPIQKAFDLQ